MCNGNHQVLGKRIFFLEDIVKLTSHSLMNFNEEVSEVYPNLYFKFYCDKIVNGTCVHNTHLHFIQEVYYSGDCILNKRNNKKLILLKTESHDVNIL